MRKILIYDEEERFADKLKKSLVKLPILKGIFDIETLSDIDFENSMKVLHNRQIALRESDKWNDEPTRLDETSIFIIDYDLLKSNVGSFLTGETVAYLARCFSKCGLIVGVNQYGHNTFDLTLKGHPESFADLNVGEDQLNISDLWRGTWVDIREGFRPWYWPSLPDYQLDFEKKVKDVKESLDMPIWEVLGFDQELFNLLPRSISQFLGKEPAKTTFRQFVIESGNGLHLKDAFFNHPPPTSSKEGTFSKSLDAENVSGDVLARVGAARISKWLERFVLPEQDILVDAPHLVSRYPSLMTGDKENIETWNKTAQLTSYKELGLSCCFDNHSESFVKATKRLSTELIEPSRLQKDYWLSRPVWFWDKLRECEKIKEVREPWETVRPNWVFCEDASQFYEEKDCKEFVADTESPFARRFVKVFDGVDYRPRVRFSL